MTMLRERDFSTADTDLDYLPYPREKASDAQWQFNTTRCPCCGWPMALTWKGWRCGCLKIFRGRTG